MDISKHRDLSTLRNINICDDGCLLQNFSNLEQDLQSIFLVNHFLVLEPRQHRCDEIQIQSLFANTWPMIVRSHRDISRVQSWSLVRGIMQGVKESLFAFLQAPLLDQLFCLLQLCARLFVARLELDGLPKIVTGLLGLLKHQIGASSAIVRLDVVGIQVDGLCGILNGSTILFKLDVGKCTVAEENGIVRIALNGLRVTLDGVMELVSTKICVCLGLELLGLSQFRGIHRFDSRHRRVP
mmetsp:Transcript_1434/g.3229  ORF Transcript_1434/g.3229 Transcript_1434/m.3229 type:complete len:240 (-) Transcript_1434:20-739(-)